MELNKTLKLPVHLSIASFFYKHPSAVDTAQGIATWIHYDVKKVEKALEELVSLEVLTVHRTDCASAYAFTSNKKIISKIESRLAKNEKT